MLGVKVVKGLELPVKFFSEHIVRLELEVFHLFEGKSEAD